MKRYLLITFFLIAGSLFAQEMINNFDAEVDTSYWAFFTSDNADTNLSFMNSEFITDNVQEGAGAMKVVYSAQNAESWGGFVKFEHWNADSNATYDWSLYDTLSIWYNNTLAANEASRVHLRVNLHDVSDATNGNKTYDVNDAEYWYSFNYVLDNEPGWTELKLSLEGLVDTDQSGDGRFHRTGWSGIAGNDKLDLDKIKGWSFEVSVNGTGTGEAINGEIIFDNMTLKGIAPNPIIFFNGVAVPANMEQFVWGGSAEVVEGGSSEGSPNSIKWTQSDAWTGTGFNMPLTNLAFHWETDTLNFKMKAEEGTGNLRIQWEDTNGPQRIGMNFDPIADNEWHQYKFALKDMVTFYDGATAFDYSNIVVMQILTEGSGSGKVVYIDDWWTGSPEFDVLPPNAPGFVTVADGDYVNLVTWTDVAGEDGETYDVYYSLNPITDVTADDVEVVELGIAENEQIATHTLKAPLVDQEVTYYYAVVCKDLAGNAGPFALADPASVTNNAKGFPTINFGAPASFAADGDLADWAGMTMIPIKSSDGTGFVVTNQSIDSDADMSVEAYLAMDDNYLYFALDMTDDINSIDTNIATYLTDGADLFIGLYDWHGASHVGHQRGEEPDYQLRFVSNAIIAANQADAVIKRPGDDYAFTEKFPSGYIIEGKLSFQELSEIATPNDAIFTPMVGKRIKIDYSVNDADGTGEREGILTLSPNNEDQSWNNVSRWTYTWIGDQMTDVDDDAVVANSFELNQNYPNPFNPTTTITYSVPTNELVTLKVFNVLGQEVKTLVNTVQKAGFHKVSFDASSLASGIYMYKITSGNFVSTKKMLLLK
jgi:hypothetical protein